MPQAAGQSEPGQRSRRGTRGLWRKDDALVVAQRALELLRVELLPPLVGLHDVGRLTTEIHVIRKGQYEHPALKLLRELHKVRVDHEREDKAAHGAA